MSILKNIHLALIIILCTFLNAQGKGKEPKTFLFGLLKFDTQSEYEDGYWINKWLFAREFASPVNIIPIEIRYGICLLYTSPSPRDVEESRMPSSA